MRKQSIVKLECVDPEISITLESKKHEDLARIVEFQLREHFRRSSIWVIPYQRNRPPHGYYPCVSLVDSNQPKTSIVFQKTTELFTQVYGSEEVPVTEESISIMPDGDGLKHVIDHLLSIHYGHRDYFVNFSRMEKTSNVIIDINDFDYLLSTYTEEDDEGKHQLKADALDDDEPCARCGIPNDVIHFVFEYARDFRPDIEFVLSSAIRPIDETPYFAPGFELVI